MGNKELLLQLKTKTSLSHVFSAHPVLYCHVALSLYLLLQLLKVYMMLAAFSWWLRWRWSSHPMLLQTADPFRVKGTFKFTDHLFLQGRRIILMPLFSCWLSCLKCCRFERLTSSALSLLLARREHARAKPRLRALGPHNALLLQSSYHIVLEWILKKIHGSRNINQMNIHSEAA